jgi:hypothetical protein
MATGLAYEIVTSSRSGNARSHPYVSDTQLRRGDVVVLGGRYWLVADLEDGRAVAKPARYRLVLRYPDSREEAGAFRRFRVDAPRLGHEFTTAPEGEPWAWVVVDERLERDNDGEPYLELVADRDFGEVEELPIHELEHALALRDDSLPESARAALARAEGAGLAVELVALEPGEAPDWAAAERYLGSLVLEEIEDDLIEMCGVDPDTDPRDSWLDAVKERLRADLERFRADIEGDHDEIEEWDFRGGRIFASVGSLDDESDPNRGHGWICRLVDAEVLGAAGFERVRKASL